MSSSDRKKLSVPAVALRSGLVALVALGGLGAIGCRQDMHDQPKLKPYRGSTFFADGSGMRTLPANTVAQGSLQEDTHFFTGRLADGSMATELPMPMTRTLAEARPGALQHLLHALPRTGRRGPRDGGPPGLQAADLVPRGAPAAGADRLLLRRDDQRLRRHAELRAAGPRRRIAGRSPPTSAPCSSRSTSRPRASRPNSSLSSTRSTRRPPRRTPQGARTHDRHDRSRPRAESDEPHPRATRPTRTTRGTAIAP